ncbi:hypothetical protein LOZ80_14870 [Paenibacillus sp. HWE-109]|uniref:hypothetical protein n=1 Tax=Paenibacillus sp. HWE-109 TaxID=1306526 RepID=UPI001EE0905A|nr:hypothetical protein [Paenibacillus sp. HWE-109]UKS30143.1 hypothetical protein LOZ80_14870 [Paenibacillus sp. HWE-109]
MTIDPVTLSQIVDVKSRIGTNADASGTNTLFARLAQIAAYVDQVEGYTDTLETLLGLTGDAASGTGSVMARLAQLNSVLGTVNTNASSANTTIGTVNTNVNTANTNISSTNTRIGANTDAAGTSTIFARLAQIYSSISGISGNYAIGASNTAQESYLPLQTLVPASSTQATLIAKLVPKGKGDLVVEAEVKAPSGGNIILGVFQGIGSNLELSASGSLDWSLPIGTILNSVPGGLNYTPSSSASFVVVSKNVRIIEKMPIYVYAWSGTGNAGGQVQNIKLKYDVVG